MDQLRSGLERLGFHAVNAPQDLDAAAQLFALPLVGENAPVNSQPYDWKAGLRANTVQLARTLKRGQTRMHEHEFFSIDGTGGVPALLVTQIRVPGVKSEHQCKLATKHIQLSEQSRQEIISNAIYVNNHDDGFVGVLMASKIGNDDSNYVSMTFFTTELLEKMAAVGATVDLPRVTLLAVSTKFETNISKPREVVQ
ncbi:hypothetical protein [Marimonas arenosa]|uniref:Uncharacterized protein n=1 Tax=Marimonas arenosa TaxID=1795305 RepID=A0AAE4B5J3_9RHOB|nr:hypothetical protein [Marimonas arenosa]MDQ2092088.1 hypothetical protein [Marimonas arenosa]